MKRFWPYLLMAAGVLILFGGFFYQLVIGGAWGYQDPTPEMQASCALHSSIAAVIGWSGVAVFLVGCVAGIRRFWPLLPIIGGVILTLGGFAAAAAFSGKPDVASFVRIVRVATMTGWGGVGVFIFGVVAGIMCMKSQKR